MRKLFNLAAISAASIVLAMGMASPALAEEAAGIQAPSEESTQVVESNGDGIAPAFLNFAEQKCGGAVRICQITEKNSPNPWSHDFASMSAWLDGGVPRTGHFQFFGPGGWEWSGPNHVFAPRLKDGNGTITDRGTVETFIGYRHGNSGDLWCARFWEGSAPNGSSGGWVDVTGPICVTG